MSPRFSVERRALPPAAVVELHGELDLARVDDVRAELDRIEAEGSAERVAVDLRDLTFLDSSGLRLLVVASGRARERGVPLVLVRGPEQVQHVFEITGMDRELTFVDDPAEDPGGGG